MDPIERINDRWKAVRPDLDPSALDVVGRVLVLAGHLDRSVNHALEAHGITLGQFDILATLRRAEPAEGLTPTQLLQSIALTSGGMTGRLDRLEEAGLIRRTADPEDRRGVKVGLTAKGRAAIDAATETRFAEARQSLSPLSASERNQLATLLKKWLTTLSTE